MSPTTSSSKHPFKARARYRFDNMMAAGAAAVILWLALATIVLILAAGAVLVIFGVGANEEEGLGFIEAVWLSLLRTLDPGTMGGDVGWGFRIVALIVTLGGIFIVSILIGLLTTGIGQKLDELRKGRTFVVEKGHTLILGWSSKLFSTISELVIANENQRRSVIVVMAPRDKVEMEDDIRTRLGHPKGTKIVCRTGDPADPNDLEIVNPLEAKSIIVLSPEQEAPDAQVIKTILALMRQDRELEQLLVVGEFVDARNARAIRSATGDRVRTVTSSEVIGQITAQVCRQSGLSAVYQELLDFAGHEIYFREEPAFAGKTFGQTVLAYEDAAVIGIRRSNGLIELAPPAEAGIQEGDSIVAIAEDDDRFTLGALEDLPALVTSETRGNGRGRKETILIIGWNSLGPMVLKELDEHVASGSKLHVIYDPNFVRPQEVSETSCSRLQLTMTEADTSERPPLAKALRDDQFEHVVILCYRNGLSAAESDARTLMTLLQVRQILEKEDEKVSLVTELLDVRDVELAMVAHPDDFVVSERLTSLMLAQLAENPELQLVFDDLFDAGGASIDLKPAADYIPSQATFADAVRATMERGEVAIGYRKAEVGDPAAAIFLNPSKSAELALSGDDRLIILLRNSPSA
jgi:voltage-gated potassium channel Kch